MSSTYYSNNSSWSSNNNNTIIGVHNLPFFGQNQPFLAKTFLSWFERPNSNFSDIVDRINCKVVPMLLLFCVMAITANMFLWYFSVWIQCHKTPELNEDERYFAIDYCQSKNTYYVAPEQNIPWSNKERNERQLGYYHWVPIMLFLQSMLFMLPNFLWNGFHQQSGIEFIQFIKESNRLKKMKLNDIERPILLKTLGDRIGEAILNRKHYFKIKLPTFSIYSGSFVMCLYIFIKLVYLLNIFGQFYILNFFIGHNYRWWGLDVLNALLTGKNWQDSPIFPRLTLCDVPIRRLGDTVRYTLQCHLRINTYNEKIYLFIWWGFLLVALITFLNFIYYLIAFICLPFTRENTIRHLLKQNRFDPIIYSSNRLHYKLIKIFTKKVIINDGILLFWFIENHAGPIVAREIMGEVFDVYLTKINVEDYEVPNVIIQS
ncbi:Innexin [Meloidogyne graminicola]|uniref:Innexin n=1 Tax=Meloidogyne graminicola TaxID=189291 RepID=A0A8S9ZVW8_9BILA|nr:Innexin [Meloidogyne graminicola]